MALSDALAELNVARYAGVEPHIHRQQLAPGPAGLQWRCVRRAGCPEPERGRPGLGPATTCAILSGLYGVLRPLDWMQPYRLEMGTRLATPAGNTLYAVLGQASIAECAQPRSWPGRRRP